MNEGHEYFANQEEEISNKFMSANGEQIVTTAPNPKNQYFDFGGMFGQQLGAIVFYGVIAYVGYRVLIKKK